MPETNPLDDLAADHEPADEVIVPAPNKRRKPRHRSGPNVGVEIRRFAADGLEVRTSADGSDTITIVGSPIVYNTPYSVRDMFGEFQETMAPGVASTILATADVRFLFNHEGLPLARTLSGTLSLSDSPEKLNFLARLDARQSLANDLGLAIERGDVTQMSCGFIVADDAWNAAQTERTIYRFSDLLDVSAVTYPASPTTNIAVAQRMAMASEESRSRLRRMWTITRDLRDGRDVDPEALTFIAEGLSALAELDEERDAPTNVDKQMPAKLAAAHDALHAALQTQMKDPDNGSDPDDESVTSHLQSALGHLVKAQMAQGIDGTPDAEDRDASIDSGDNNVDENSDGTQDEPSEEPSVADDGTGTRSAEIVETEIRKRRIAMRMQIEALR